MALQHLRSSTANKRPTPAGMSDGQLALNTNNTSPGLFFKDSNGALVKVGPVHVGTTAPNATPGAGGSSGNAVGEQWLDTSGANPVLKIWNGSAWQAASGGASVTTSDTAPSIPSDGDLWYDSVGGRLYVYYQDPNGSQWVDASPQASGTSITTGNTSAQVVDTGSDGRFVVTTEGSERIRVDAQGRVGIGTTVPPYRLTVKDTADQIHITNPTAGDANSDGFTLGFAGLDAQFINRENGSLIFFQNNNEAFRVDPSRRLLVGTSSARASSVWDEPVLQIEGTTYQRASLSVINNQNSAAEPGIILGKSRGTTLGSNTVVQSGDFLGTIAFQGSDGSSLLRGAQISCAVDATPGANDMPGRLVFSTTADGASSPTERMRITNDGTVGIGVTSPTLAYTDAVGVQFSGSGYSVYNRDGGTLAFFNRRVSNGNAIEFARSGTGVGSISVTTTATAYNTSSDYRLKENVTPVTDGITRLQQLKPSRFNFIAEPGKTVDGFLAHEAAEVVPECVTGEKDAVDDEGNPIYQGIDQSKLVPLLTAALQEAIAKIESLEARLTAAGI